MATERERFMREHGIRPPTDADQLFLIRALLGLNPEQDTVEAVRVLMELGPAKFVIARGRRYDVLNSCFADWAAPPSDLTGERNVE